MPTVGQDPAWLNETFRQHLCRVAAFHGMTGAENEDAVQEALLTTWLKSAVVEHPVAYAGVIIKRAAWRAAAELQLQRSRYTEQWYGIANETDIEGDLIKRERATIVDRAILKLPAMQRDVLLRWCEEDTSTRGWMTSAAWDLGITKIQFANFRMHALEKLKIALPNLRAGQLRGRAARCLFCSAIIPSASSIHVAGSGVVVANDSNTGTIVFPSASKAPMNIP